VTIEQENRLARCFASVFPELNDEEIRSTSAESNGTWDSLSKVTLTAVIEEEFDIQIAPDILAELESFSAFRSYLQTLDISNK
jgi:acyl carrier protein